MLQESEQLSTVELVIRVESQLVVVDPLRVFLKLLLSSSLSLVRLPLNLILLNELLSKDSGLLVLSNGVL